MTERALLRRIITTDYMTVVLLGLGVAVSLGLFPFGLLGWLLFGPLLWSRIRLIKRVIEQGASAQGVVVERAYRRGEWRVRYRFEAEGQLQEAGNWVLGWSLPFNKGDQVMVRYNPERPTQAFLPALYANPLGGFQKGCLAFFGLLFLLLFGCVGWVVVDGMMNPPTVTLPYTTSFDGATIEEEWVARTVKGGSAKVRAGEMVILVTEERSTMSRTLDTSWQDNVIIQARGHIAQGDGLWGVVCRASYNGEEAYSFNVTFSYYEIAVMQEGRQTSLGRTKRTGDAQAAHEIEARCVEETLTFLVDGAVVLESKSSKLERGYVGVRGGAGQVLPGEVRISDFAVTSP